MLKESREQTNHSLTNAQQKALDALKISHGVPNDTLQVQIRLQLGTVVSLRGDNREALRYFEQALELSEQSNYPRGHCNALLKIGTVFYTWGEYDKSLSFFQKSLELAEQNNYREEKVQALNFMGKYYHTRGYYNQSVEYYKAAAEAYQSLKDNDRLITLYLNMGKTYISEGNIYMTLNYYLKAFDACEKTGDQLLKADVYNHLGSIYLLLKQPDKSFEYHRKALKIRRSMKSPEAIASSCNNLGETFLYLSEYDSASVYLHESYQQCLLSGYRKGTVKALTNLGRANNGKEKFAQARVFLNKALQLSKEAGYDAGIVESTITLGQNCLQTGNYQQAVYYFEQSLSRMIPANLNEFQADAYRGLYECYSAQGKYQQALAYHVKLAEAERLQLMAEGDRQLAELRISFDLERKESDNQKLRQENELKQLALAQRSWIIWSVVVILAFTIALCLLIYGRYIQKRKAHNELQRLIRELELANTEKDKMFSIIAHELRNPLYWFQNLTEVLSKNHAQMTPEKLQKSLNAIDESAKNAFHLMDNLLNWSRTRLNRITPRKASHELSVLVRETLRMFETVLAQKEIELLTTIPENTMIYADADMFSCILRNLISNAIKYTPSQGRIRIESSSDHQFCTVRVCDSGIGVPLPEADKLFSNNNFNSSLGLMQEKGSGLGLKLCKEFSVLNGGQVWVTSEKEHGTCFAFTVPLAS